MYEKGGRKYTRRRALTCAGIVRQCIERIGWHHFLPRKQMCQAYAAEWLVRLLRFRWIIQDSWLLMSMMLPYPSIKRQ